MTVRYFLHQPKAATGFHPTVTLLYRIYPAARENPPDFLGIHLQARTGCCMHPPVPVLTAALRVLQHVQPRSILQVGFLPFLRKNR